MKVEKGVIPALMDSLAEAREDAKMEYRHIRAHTPTSERMLRRYESKENYPAGSDIDGLVDAYAKAIGGDMSVFDLWNQAINRAREAQAKLERGIGPTEQAPSDERLAQDVLEALDAEVPEPEQGAQKKRGKRAPKAKRRRAG